MHQPQLNLYSTSNLGQTDESKWVSGPKCLANWNLNNALSALPLGPVFLSAAIRHREVVENTGNDRLAGVAVNVDVVG